MHHKPTDTDEAARFQQELTELETRFWTGGADFYRDHLTSDALMVFPGLGIADREAIIQGIADGQRWDSVDMEQPHILPLSPDVAAFIYSAKATRGDENYEAFVSSVYRREGGRWKLALHQQS